MRYALGYDMGVGSLGFAVIALSEDGEPEDVLDIGVRIFSTAREPDKGGKIGEPLAASRRAARGVRKRSDRLKMRRKSLMKQLIRYGLMPDSVTEQKMLETLNPLELRAKGVTEPLSLYELGRALFHMQQRRGYKSNRHEGDNEQTGVIETGGRELRQKLAAYDMTLGQYLYHKPDQQRGSRFRKNMEGTYTYYPMRDMVEREFTTLWNIQQGYHPMQLNDEARDAVHRAIFYQRPLKPQPRGACLYYTMEERAPMALPLAQRFRILQQIHNMRIIGGHHQFSGIPLSVEEKQRIYEKMLVSESVKESDVKKLLALQGTQHINLFRANVTDKLKGDKTAVEMEKVYGKEWYCVPLEVQNKIVSLLTDCEKITQPHGKSRLLEHEEIIERLIECFDCTDEQAHAMANVKLSSTMASFSAKLLAELVPQMEPLGGNRSLSEAIAMLNVPQSRMDKECDLLPYYAELLGNHCTKMPSADKHVRDYGRVSNPTVHVALNQLRKVHNSLITRFGGKPEYITIELVRELKKGQREIADIIKENDKNKKLRHRWKEEIKQELGIEANDRDLAKMKLWKELAESNAANERICVFTGKPIRLSQLLSADIEIEHILPRSLTLDDTSANKTVSFVSFNRLKGKQAPEALFASPVLWEGRTISYEDMVERADHLRNAKAWRFRKGAMQSFEEKSTKIIYKGEEVDTGLESFAARHLIDTSHMAKLAKKYLAYGCAQGERGMIATPGTLTGLLRQAWGWNSLLAEDDAKDRTDHRHHAVDALVIALTTRSMVKHIAEAAKIAEITGRKLSSVVGEMTNPFAHKRHIIQSLVDKMVVSHKPEHGTPAMNGGTTGRLHEDTYYGRTQETPKSNAVYVVRWKPEEFTTRKHVEKIEDKLLRDTILTYLEGVSDKETATYVQQFCKNQKIHTIRALDEKNAVYVVRWKPEEFTTRKDVEKIRDKRLRDTILTYLEGVSDKEIATYVQQFCAHQKIRAIRALDEKSKNAMVEVRDPVTKQPYKFMVGGSNHCVDIFIETTGKKAHIWQSEIIKTFDANQKDFVPEWKSEPNRKLIWRLHKDDIVGYEKEGKTMYARVQTLKANGQIFFVQHNDADGKTSFSMMPAPAQKAKLRKISVSPDGVVLDPMRVQQGE
ncbi:MAG: type II CRISPR RNA-guided endonuclease Cas9 [Alphaproteobacteria bacterium]|nr:MAG: type II CRISPR RNA-guided endonuclease Cas9 [Alphaproteobacteria bacterium]